MRRLLRMLAPLAALAALGAAAAPAPAATGLAPARGFVPREVVVKFAGETGRAVALPAGVGVRRAARALRQSPAVEYATPNYVATASAAPEPPAAPLFPDDSGTLEGGAEAASSIGGWAFKQWNFLSPTPVADGKLPSAAGGIDVVGAWRNLEAAGRPGGRGVRVAVLDTGIAYRSHGKFRRSPDFSAHQFARGYDFVDRDPLPLDENGHGTHVAGTIGERTGNGLGLTGIAYRAKLLPVRVLDRQGRGDAATIARGIRFAVAHGAQVVNMSFNFGCGKQVPVVDEALREAYLSGVLTVASAGNLGAETCVSAPATGPRVIAVGGTTEGACLGDYSLAGRAIDIVAPGGGRPAAGCPSVASRPIYQVTLRGGTTNVFGIPGNYVGTSMAAAHVSGVAALAIAAGVGRREKPRARVEVLTRRLLHSARDLGLPRTRQGAGLLDAAAATSVGIPAPAARVGIAARVAR